MFFKYEIINDILYLYIDDKYEIGDFIKFNKLNIKDLVLNFIKERKIIFNGVKVILITGGIIIGSIMLNTKNDKSYDIYNGIKYVSSFNINEELNNVNEDKVINDNSSISTQNKVAISDDFKENIKQSKVESNYNKENKLIDESNSISNNENITVNKSNVIDNKENIVKKEDKVISIKRTSGEIQNIKLQDYLIGVVAAEMPASFNEEALKVQAVIARTYTFKLIEQKRQLTDDVKTQVYKDNYELKNIWSINYDLYYKKIKDAVDATDNLTIKYNGSYIDAVYHSTSNGYTEDSYNVWNNSLPYLKSVSSSWDVSTSQFLKEKYLTFDEISNKLGFNFSEDSIIEIISRNESNRISKIKIDNNVYTGVELRNLLGLRSADFTFEILDKKVKFITKGYGHGVGLSQYGANEMANLGYSFLDIIKYYYTNVEIN